MKARLAAFFTVGGIGFVLQMVSLAALTTVARWPYWIATAAAVELAVLHNFWWHERWTWADRQPAVGGIALAPGWGMRLLKYEASTGTTSIAGNVVLTALLVEWATINPVPANACAVALMSAANFLLADRWVFLRPRAASAAATILAAAILFPAPAESATLSAKTLAAWNQHVAAFEADISPSRPLADPGGEPEGETIAVPGGLIHRWRGSVMLRETTVDALVTRLLNPGTPPPQDDVLESRVLAGAGDSRRVYLKLSRSAIVTVTYHTEHDVTFERHGPKLATSRSVATRIEEVGGGDRGFLWRLNSYWRYVQVGRDVRVELESLSLSRSMPAVLRPVASPIVSRIAKESVVRTLEAMRRWGRNSAERLSWPNRTNQTPGVLQQSPHAGRNRERTGRVPVHADRVHL